MTAAAPTFDEMREQAKEPAPGLFICIELVPLMEARHLEGLSTQQLFALAGRLPERFKREWHTFPTLPEAEEFAGRSATLTVLPLVIEHNPLLGY